MSQKARWVPLAIPAPLWKKGANFQGEGWTERLSWQTEWEWLESSRSREGAADGAGDEEMQREKHGTSHGEQREISALQVKTKQGLKTALWG